jgi:hypothetical protein
MRNVILVLTIVFALVHLSCGGTYVRTQETSQGGKGFRCDDSSDCRSPLACENTPYFSWPVCSGVKGEGESCSTDDECKYVLNTYGLPLLCVSTEVCAFAPAEFDVIIDTGSGTEDTLSGDTGSGEN